MTHFTVLNLRPFDQDNTTYIGVYNDNDTVNPNGIIEKIANHKVIEEGFDFSLHGEYNNLKSKYSHISALGFEEHNDLKDYMEEIAATKEKPVVLKLYRETEEYLIFNNDITYGKEEESSDSESFSNDFPLTETPFNLLNGIINVLENSSKNDKNGLIDHFSDFLTGALGSENKDSEESENNLNKEQPTEKEYNKMMGDLFEGNFRSFDGQPQDFIGIFDNWVNNKSTEKTEHLNNPFDPKDFLSDYNKDSEKSKTVGHDTIKDYFDSIESVEKEFSKKQEKLEQEKKLALEKVKNRFFREI